MPHVPTGAESPSHPGHVCAPAVDDLAAHHQKRAMRAFTLNAAELIRHPGATAVERDQAEWLVLQVRRDVIPVDHAHAAISRTRAEIRARWTQQAA